MIDIHNHIIPGVDDGSKDIETSIKMLEIAEADGIKTIAATPHYLRGRYEAPYETVLKMVNLLQNEARNRGLKIEIIPGQEILIDNNTIKDYKEKKIGCINKTKYMLVELPMDKIPDYALDMIYELRLLNIKPILAHPERYEYIINNISTINEFANEGCLFQINTGSITGIFGNKVQKTAEKLIKHRFCNFIASDSHSINRRRPGFKAALDIIQKEDSYFPDMLNINTNNLVNNKDIKCEFQTIKDSRSIFNIFKK